MENKESLCSQLGKPRTIFAFMFYATACYLIVMQLPVPQELNTIVSMLLGYYFGAKNKKADNGEKKGG